MHSAPSLLFFRSLRAGLGEESYTTLDVELRSFLPPLSIKSLVFSTTDYSLVPNIGSRAKLAGSKGTLVLVLVLSSVHAYTCCTRVLHSLPIIAGWLGGAG